MKILFFIESLHYGGKERLTVELLTYLKENTDHELMIVLTKKDIQYANFLKLNIPYEVIERKWLKKDPRIFFMFYRICKKFKPDLIHVFGNMVAFYSLPTVILSKIPMLNNQISDAPPKLNKLSLSYIMSRFNFRFSNIILSNSQAGLKSYQMKNEKSKVIYNGINLERFKNLKNKEEVKERYGIITPFSVIMVGSFSDNKDYDKYINIAKVLNSQRNDVTFVSVGNGYHFNRIKNRVGNEKIPNFIFTGRIDDIESLISACDVGTLFSPNGEGISCVITEYMALRKPVIADNTGGTKEIVRHQESGYLVKTEGPKEIAELINNLLEDKDKRIKMGSIGRQIIENSFTIDKMGEAFVNVYNELKQK